MREIFNIIEELKLNNSSNYKQEVLTKYKDNKKLKKFLLYIYNPRFNYYMTELPKIKVFRHYTNDCIWDDFYLILDDLRNREITGNKAKEQFTSILGTCADYFQILYSYVIARDIKAGVSTKTINKVFPNLIPEIPYARCSKLSDFKDDNFFKDNKRALLQKKLDGVFSYIIKKNNQVSFLTRNGTEYFADSYIELLMSVPNNTVLVGEALIKHNGKELDRKTGNGLINKFIKAESTFETLERSIISANSEKVQAKFQDKKIELEKSFRDIEESLSFELWDILTLEEFEQGLSTNIYSDRLVRLESLVSKLCSNKLRVVDTYEVSSLEEANEIANRYISEGFEGEGKYKGKIGSLFCSSSCGNLIVNVGSGFTDAERELPEEVYLNKIVTVKYNEKISKKDSKVESLFLPIFIEVRIDKDEADSLEDIL